MYETIIQINFVNNMVTTLDKHYAKELKKLRKDHNLKQIAMVEFLNIESQQQYSDLENGKKHFTDKLILKICAIFRISIIQFIQDPIQSSIVGQFLSKEDLLIIENCKDDATKTIIYKKLFLESKIENIENKLKTLHKDYNGLCSTLRRHKVHVII